MEQVISATEARIHFGAVMRRVVESDTPVIVERNGKPQVVVMSSRMYHQFCHARDASDWEKLLRETRELVRAELKGRELPPPEEIIRQMREERDEQLTGLH